MKKALRFLVLFAVVFAITLTCVACSGGNNQQQKIDTSGSFELSHFDGSDIETYDTDLLWRNQTYALNDGGGDSGVLWVDPADDPVNGGYFYMYTSGSSAETADGQSPTPYTGQKAYDAWIHCYRSKDLMDWEACGAVNKTFCMAVYENSWIESYLFAPECTCAYNPYLGKMQYYLYFSARSKTNNNELRAVGAKYSDVVTENYFDRFYLSCAISDSPCGPFVLASSEAYYGNAEQPNGNGVVISDVNPVFLVDEECDELWMTDELRNAGKDEGFSAIDISPFWDDDELYIYFCRHFGAGGPDGSTVWGIKMKDPITPDWSTLTMLLGNSYTTKFVGSEYADDSEDPVYNAKFVRCEYKGETQCDPRYPRHLASSYTSYTRYDGTYYPAGTASDDQQREYNLIEAPSMVKSRDSEGNPIYCLMYAPIGVSDFNYNVKLSVGTSPLGPFVKINESDGATVLGVDAEVNDFMSNLGHVQFVTVDDELWIAHYQQQAPFGGVDQGRPYALSSCSLQYNENLKMYLPVANGPTTSLQPRPSVATGYRNVASDATVTATNAIGDTVKYLTDGMWVTRSTNAAKEFRAKGSTTITLDFDHPVYARSLFVFNSYTYSKAIKSISQIVFDLAETPAWHDGGQTSCYIDGLKYNGDDYRLNLNNGAIFQTGSALLATFNEIKVKKITIVINNDDMQTPGEEFRISDIVVLGSDVSIQDQTDLSDEYTFEYNRPYAGDPDSFMTVDGKLDEAIWDECTFTDNTVNGIRVRTSTFFTTKGVYIAMQAFSKNIEYSKRFTDRSAFHLIVTKSGTTTYQDNAYETFGPDHAQKFDCDAYYARSFSRIPYYYNAVVDGEINSGNTNSITAELFLTWKDLYYDEDELTDGGVPESIQIYNSFGGQILGTCSWRLETFPHYGAYGYLGDTSANGVGSVENGPQSTDQWLVNDSGNLYTRAGRAQIAWIEEAHSSDFIVTATLKAEKSCTFRNENIYGNMGYTFMTDAGLYNMYLVDAKEVENNGAVIIKTAREIDSFHWINQIGYSETVQQSGGIEDNTIGLTLIKRANKFYYLYNGTYYESETLSDEYNGKGWIGFYTSSGIEIVDYEYTDYSNDTSLLESVISDFIYEVNTPQKTVRGSVFASNSSVKRGEPVKLYVRANAGYMLTGLALNGNESFYNDVVANLDENSTYTFVPTCDVTITAKFDAIPKEALVDSIIAFRDGNESLIDATYSLKTSNPLIFYDDNVSSINAKGNVVIKLVKKGTYTVGNKTLVFDGDYDLTLKVNEYRDKNVSFHLEDNVDSTSLEGLPQNVGRDGKFTTIVNPIENEYGTLKVNGATPSWYGKLNYDDQTGDYSVDHAGVFAYFKNMVGFDHKVSVKMNFSEMENNVGTDPISGLAITSGSYSIVFKVNRDHSPARLIIAAGGSSLTYVEYAVSGIPSSIGAREGEFEFTVARCNNVIYFIDCNGLLKFTISSSGLEFYNGCGTGWGWDSGDTVGNMNQYYKNFFKQGDQSAFGVVSYNAGGVVSWDFDYDNNAKSVSDYVNAAKEYKVTTKEISWISNGSVGTYKSWRSTMDGKYTASNPGVGGCYTALVSTTREACDNFTYTFKVKCADMSKLGVGVGCISSTGSCLCGINLSYNNNNLRLMNMRYATPQGWAADCDWPTLDLGANDVVSDGEFYMKVVQTGKKTEVFVGDSTSSMTCIANLEEDWIRTTVESYIPALFAYGYEDGDAETTAQFSEVVYLANK